MAFFDDLTPQIFYSFVSFSNRKIFLEGEKTTGQKTN